MIQYIPWKLRGYSGDVYQVYVNNEKSSLTFLRELKKELNNPPVRGLLLAENSSRALERLGWEALDDGLWYKIFE